MKFKNKRQAMSMRRDSYVCKCCGTIHDKQSLGLVGRPSVCISCKTVQNFYYFASKAELQRYSELLLQQKAKIIYSLETQVTFPLQVRGVYITRYVADFTYTKNNVFVIEDVKGHKDHLEPVFKIKAKLVHVLYGTEILITTRS